MKLTIKTIPILLFFLISVATKAQLKNIKDKIRDVVGRGYALWSFANDNNGGYFLLYNHGNGCASWTSSSAKEEVDDLYNKGKTIKSISFTADGSGWVIIYGRNGYSTEGNVPNSLTDMLTELNDQSRVIDFVQFSNNNGWVVVYDEGMSYSCKNFPANVEKNLRYAYDNKRKIKSVAFEPYGGSVVCFGYNGYSYSDVSNSLDKTLEKIGTSSEEIKFVAITEYSEHLVVTDTRYFDDFSENYQIDNYLNFTSTYMEYSNSSWTSTDANSIWVNGRRVYPKLNLHSDNVLTITRAYVRDDGEAPQIEPAALGIHIAYSNDGINWERYGRLAGELIGRWYAGMENGKAKLEWRDYEGITYSNYAILDWDSFKKYKYIGIVLIEGDEGNAWWSPLGRLFAPESVFDDVIFKAYITVEELRSGKPVKLESNRSNHATLWLQTKRKN